MLITFGSIYGGVNDFVSFKHPISVLVEEDSIASSIIETSIQAALADKTSVGVAIKNEELKAELNNNIITNIFK